VVSRRSLAFASGLAFLTVAAVSTPAPAQIRDAPKTLTPDEWDQVKPLFTLVEDVAAGKQAPADVALTWQSHFLKAVSNMLFVPFTLTIEKGQFTSFSVAMYVRVVGRGEPAPAPGPRDPLARYPFEDAALFDVPENGRISRAFVAPAGEWDVYVALRERPGTNTLQPKTVVFKQPVSLPDLRSNLAVSSIIVAEKIEVEAGNRRLTLEEQLEDPYMLWGTRITPAWRTRFGRSAKLSVVFLIYNTGVAAHDKPDVSVQYDFHRKTGVTETLFGSTSPQVFNAWTLRPEFSLAAGDLVIAGQDMPLAHFPEGDYRLALTITDRTNGESLERDVNFAVVAGLRDDAVDNASDSFQDHARAGVVESQIERVR
jgi:hypothetical protein